MTQDEVMALMESSKSDKEWNDNCEIVKRAHGGGYPDWWFTVMIMDGKISEISSKWESTQ